MPTFNTADDQARYALVPFDEAINYLGGKINQDTDKWNDLATPQEHDAAFVVAGMKGALLQDIRAEVEKALREGKSRDDFKAEFRDIVDRRGWSSKQGNDWRANIIYETNLRQAYGDGRCRQMNDPDVIAARPYRMWAHGDSRVPRPEHRAMNGKVFRGDHPVAQTKLPCGYKCKCTWVSLSERDMKRLGLSVETGINWGSIIPTAKGNRELKIDPGFGAACKFESEEEKEERKKQSRKDILARIPPANQRDATKEIILTLAIAIPIAALAAFALLNIGVAGVSTASVATAASASAAANLAKAILQETFEVDAEVLPTEMVKKYRKQKNLDSAPIDVVTTEMRQDLQDAAAKYLQAQPQNLELDGVANRLAIAQSKKKLLLPQAGDLSQPNVDADLDITATIPRDRTLTPPMRNVPNDRALAARPPGDLVAPRDPILPPDPATRPAPPATLEVRKITSDELSALRQSAKRDLPFRIRLNKNADGTFNVQPTIDDGYKWTPEQTDLVGNYLRSKGVYISDKFDPAIAGWQEGAINLKVAFDADMPLSTQPLGDLTIQTPAQKYRGQAFRLQKNLEETDAAIAANQVAKDRDLERLSQKLDAIESNPFADEIAARYDAQGKLLERRAKLQRSKLQGLLLDAQKLEEYDRIANTTLGMDVRRQQSRGEAVADWLTNPETARALELEVKDAIAKLPVAQAKLEGLERLGDELSLSKDLLKSVKDETKATTKKLNQLAKNVRTIEADLAAKGEGLLGGRSARALDSLEAAKADLAATQARLSDLEAAQTNYADKVKTLTGLVKDAVSDRKALEREVKGYRRSIDDGIPELNRELQIVKRLENLKSAMPELETAIVNSKNQIEIPKPPAVKPAMEKRYVRRKYADDYAKKIGGEVLVQVDENGKNIYVVVPKSPTLDVSVNIDPTPTTKPNVGTAANDQPVDPKFGVFGKPGWFKTEAKTKKVANSLVDDGEKVLRNFVDERVEENHGFLGDYLALAERRAELIGLNMQSDPVYKETMMGILKLEDKLKKQGFDSIQKFMGFYYKQFDNLLINLQQNLDVTQLPKPQEIDLPGFDVPFVLKTLEDFHRLTGGRGASTINKLYAEKRIELPFAIRPQDNNGVGLLSVGKGVDFYHESAPRLGLDFDTTLRKYLFHEAAHHFEFEVGSEASVDFIKTRATGAQVPINTIDPRYPGDFPVYPDNFFHPYTGRVYDTGTELVSMGLENFINPGFAANFFAKDREHLLFILGLLRK